MIRRKLYYQMKYYVFFLHCSFLISLSGIAQVDKMNKSELREFAKTCISEKTQLTKELEQQINYGKNTLSQIHIQAEKILQLKNKLNSQKESHKISKELLNAKNAYIGKLQYELQTLESQSINSEFQTLSSKEDFLHQMTGYLKPKLNDHELELELVAIHVKQNLIPNEISDDYNNDDLVLGKIWSVEDLQSISFLKKMYHKGGSWSSYDGIMTYSFPQSLYLYANKFEHEDYRSIRANILKGKLMTFNFGNRVSKDFLLKGLNTSQRWEIGKSDDSPQYGRMTLELVESEEEAIQLDVVYWNDEVLLAITPSSLEALGADFSFGFGASGIQYFRNDYSFNVDDYNEYEINERFKNSIFSAKVERTKMEFYIASDNCEGNLELNPNILLFRVNEVFSDDESSKEEEEEENNNDLIKRISMSQVSKLPSTSSCNQSDFWNQLECFEYELLSLIEKQLEYPPIARDANIQGTVFVNFTLTSDALIKNASVLIGVDKRLDQEAINVLNRISKTWTVKAATGYGGLPIDMEMCLPVRFSLE